MRVIVTSSSWPLRNLHCDANAFVSSVKRSGQIKQVWADARINKRQLFEIKLCSIFRIEYKAIELVLIKKNQQLHSRSQYWNDNEATPANGGFVNKANTAVT